LAAIAIPRFTGIRERSAISADAATADQMISAARIVEAEQNLTAGTALTATGTWNTTVTDGDEFMVLSTALTPASGGAFAVSYANDVYSVKWTPTGYNEATVTEGSTFTVPSKK
jgi:hypothetical protein